MEASGGGWWWDEAAIWGYAVLGGLKRCWCDLTGGWGELRYGDDLGGLVRMVLGSSP